MRTPPKIVALDDKGGPPGMTCDEWVLIERYIRNSGLDSWGQWSEIDKVAVTQAFQKVYCYPRVPSGAVAKMWEYADEVRMGKALQ
jgi:hypothetical protein